MQKRLVTLILVLLMCNVQTLYAASVTVSSSLSASETYSDNVDLANKNEQDSRITTVGANLSGHALWPTASLILNYSPSYSKYDEYDEYDSWRHSAGLSFNKTFARYTTLSLRNTYLQTNDPQDEAPAVDAQPNQDPDIERDINRRGRSEYYTNVASARLAHQLGEDGSIYAGYRYFQSDDIDDPIGDPRDENNNGTFNAGADYTLGFTPRWRASLGASYANSIYEEEDKSDRQEYNGNVRLSYDVNRQLSTYVAYRHTILAYDQEDEEDYQVYQPSIGMNYQFDETSGFDIALAYYYQDYEDSEDDGNFNVNSKIYKRWEYPRWHIGITGSSGYRIDDNNSTDNGLNIYYQARLDAGYNFTRWFSSSIYTSYRRNEYPDETPDRTNNSIDAGAGLSWQVARWFSTSLTYDRSQVIDDRETNEYTENSVTLRITITPSAIRMN